MKILNILFIVIISLNLGVELYSQNHYLVFFTDKNNTEFNPYEYFDQKAIDRRLKMNLSLYDSTDFPINIEYKQNVSENCQDLFFESRWFNCVAVVADEYQRNIISNFPFVLQVEPLQSSETILAQVDNTYDDDNIIESAKEQINILGAEKWKQNNINGKGVRIAIFDGGFTDADNNEYLEHIISSDKLIATKDFTKRNHPSFVYYGGFHGTAVLSCIAGKKNEIQLGLATEAEFLLAKTEKKSEYFKEELNWAAAAEWADKNGADIINSSLGYTYHRYFVTDMDGKTSYVAKAAKIATQKGMLVVNAAGNDGSTSSKWTYISTPADVEEVLTVGAIEPGSGYHSNFSSFGPTSDLRMKPNVVAFGNAVVSQGKKVTRASGTSFASPLIAGFAACALQSKPNYTNTQLFDAIEKSANLYPYFDYAHGYGIPQAEYFVDTKENKISETFIVVNTQDSILINIKDTAFLNDEDYTTDIKTYSENKYIYYKISDNNDIIKKYYVIRVDETIPLRIKKSDIPSGDILTIHYKGYTKKINN